MTVLYVTYPDVHFVGFCAFLGQASMHKVSSVVPVLQLVQLTAAGPAKLVYCRLL